eukprot:TRINITY_DN15734_c0_g1_i1.p1 TRINITY_DN15734_c0_g1~~TRINITY_DN15734_c0_g1_i1.p1  ORF type:complete len:102 (-),score=26.93 TRINITY_DN15734_c0_g1_i1:180-485(-)
MGLSSSPCIPHCQKMQSFKAVQNPSTWGTQTPSPSPTPPNSPPTTANTIKQAQNIALGQVAEMAGLFMRIGSLGALGSEIFVLPGFFLEHSFKLLGGKIHF